MTAEAKGRRGFGASAELPVRGLVFLAGGNDDDAAGPLDDHLVAPIVYLIQEPPQAVSDPHCRRIPNHFVALPSPL